MTFVALAVVGRIKLLMRFVVLAAIPLPRLVNFALVRAVADDDVDVD